MQGQPGETPGAGRLRLPAAAGRVQGRPPDVIIGEAGFGSWQARIPEPNGEAVITRHTLRELLDRPDELTSGQGGGPG